MGIPIRRASSVSQSDFDPVASIQRALSEPITQEKIAQAEKIFNQAIKGGFLSQYGQLSCSYGTYSRSIEPYDQATEAIKKAKEAFCSLKKLG